MHFSLGFLSNFNRKAVDVWIKKPVDLLLDASGIRLMGRSIWFCIRTNQKILKKDCDKIHIAVSLCSLLIANFRISNSKANDSPFLKKLLKFLFDIIGEMSSHPAYKGRLNITLAMPRSASDVVYSTTLLQQRLTEANRGDLVIGRDINLSAFTETPYWLLPSAALPREVRDLCQEPVKEDTIKDSNGKITWGTGDLTACFMASSREIPEMKGYLSTRAEVLDMMRKSIRAWNEIGFIPDVNGSFACKPFKTDEENIRFYSMLTEGDIQLSVFPPVFLDVKRLIKEVERRRK